MWFSSWLTNRNPSQAGTHGRTPSAPRKRPSFRPQLETLEDRWLPSTLTVNTAADANPPADTLSLREAINVVNTQSEAGLSPAQQAQISGTLGSNDTIVFDPSLAGIALDSGSGQLVINKSLTIQGPVAPQAPVTIYGGNSASRIFEIDGPSTQVALSNLNLTDGQGTSGGAPGTAALEDQGGAIWNDGILTLTACNLSSNVSFSDRTDALGGAIYNAGMLTLNTCNLSGNVCYGSAGGAIYNAGTLTVNNSTLSSNQCSQSNAGLGGAIYNAGTLTVNTSTLSSNTAGSEAGALVPEYAGDGGAIYNAGTMSITDSILSGNQALGSPGLFGYGGGIFNALHASATVTGSSLSDNVAGDEGGGIYNDGTMTLSGSTVSGNQSPLWGGGIFNDLKGRLTIQSKSSITNNSPADLQNLGWVQISKDSSVGWTIKGWTFK
jgi:hypothetical protein